MSSWGESWGLAFGSAWGEVAPPPEFVEPMYLTVSSGCNELTLSTGNNYLDLEDG